MKFSLDSIHILVFGLITSPTRVTDYTPRSDKRDADSVFLKIDERKCLATRGWRQIHSLRVALCHRTSIPPISLLSPFSRVLKFNTFGRREWTPLPLLKEAPEYLCHGEARFGPWSNAAGIRSRDRFDSDLRNLRSSNHTAKVGTS